MIPQSFAKSEGYDDIAPIAWHLLHGFADVVSIGGFLSRCSSFLGPFQAIVTIELDNGVDTASLLSRLFWKATADIGILCADEPCVSFREAAMEDYPCCPREHQYV